jgi:diguanylate cyclase (GGDEF)-like protein
VSKVTQLKVGFVAGIVVMLLNALVPWQTFSWLSKAGSAIDTSEDIITAASEAESSLKDAETGQRGFIITGREEFLQPYQEGVRNIRPQLVRLQSLLDERPASKRRVIALVSLIDDKLRQMERSIALRREHGLERAAREVSAGHGKELMDGIRATVAELVLSEQSRLAELKREESRLTRIAAYAIAVVTLVDLLVLGVVYTLVFSMLSRRTAAEAELRTTGERLTAGMAALEARNHEMHTCRRMTEALQSCASMDECYALIARFGNQLFPANAGVLYIFHPSRDVLESVCEWGSPRLRRAFMEPADCWALRRSQAHLANDLGADLICPHAASAEAPLSPHLCVPLSAQGDAIGLLSIESAAAEAPIDAPLQAIAETIAEQLSLSLSNMRLREAMHQQSITDALTGLYNRRYLEETLRRELLRAARKQQVVSLIMLDADHFKRFNDTFGHDAGDLVLRTLAGLMRQHARATDIVCRYGGEEFVMIMPEMDLAMALQRAGQLCESARLLNVRYGDQPLGRVTISAGVAAYPDHGGEPEALIQAADLALYAAKNAGRDRFHAAAKAA